MKADRGNVPLAIFVDWCLRIICWMSVFSTMVISYPLLKIFPHLAVIGCTEDYAIASASYIAGVHD